MQEIQTIDTLRRSIWGNPISKKKVQTKTIEETEAVTNTTAATNTKHSQSPNQVNIKLIKTYLP